jgi:glycosyltransferase involved in cell wall biosynthesis
MLANESTANSRTSVGTEGPLVTFAVIAYNQENYIREAIEGAFSQNYPFLEIVVSDDCSDDETFSIMEEMVSSYEGPHKLVLNRNDNNLGICGHYNKAIGMSSGDLVVLAAGDDISFPNRTKVLLQSWLKYGRPGLIVSGFEIIDSDGSVSTNQRLTQSEVADSPIFSPPTQRCRNEFLFEKAKFEFCGATQAVSKDLNVKFGDIDERAKMEDASNSFRSLLCGGRLYIPEKLLKYRVHDSSISYAINSKKTNSFREQESKFRDLARFKILSYRTFPKDLEVGKDLGLLDAEEFRSLSDRIAVKTDQLEWIVNWWGLSIVAKLKMYFGVIRKVGTKPQKRWARKRFLGLKSTALILKFKRAIRSNWIKRTSYPNQTER